MSNFETVIVVLGIMAYSIGRQIAGELLRLKRLIGLPVALTVIGIVDVARSKGPGPTHLDLVLIGAGCAINAVIGICQGRLMRLESRHGYLWGQMPRSVLWWWAAKIASGIILDGIGHALGAQLATTSAVMLLGLGVNRLAQAVIVAPRGYATGVPFAPEPDKSGARRKDDPSAEGTNPVSSPTAPTVLPPSMKRQLAQVLLREFNNRINDTLKSPKEEP
jgi:hypothetical protein